MQRAVVRPRSSLAHSTLLRMGLGIAVVVALATLFSYLHMVRSIRTEALAQLARYVEARGQREQAIFVLAGDNLTLLKKALEERIRAWSQEDPAARFDSLFARLPDGSTRSRPEGFDGTRTPGGHISEGIPITDELRRRFLASHETLAQFGPAFHLRFTNTYISLPEGAIAIYWPENPTWSHKAKSRLSAVAPEPEPATNAEVADELWASTRPENNPNRRTLWSGIYWEKVSSTWMVSVSTPMDLDGRHVATISHDILIRELMNRTLNDRLPGAYNLLFRDDGMLIAHPELMRGDSPQAHDILNAAEVSNGSGFQVGTREQRAHLKSTFERVKNRPPGQTVVEDPEYGEYLAVTRLEGPGWNLVTVLPQAVVTQPAAQAARYVLLVGLASLLLELAIMYWVLRVQISRPLLAFTRATDKVAAGDFKVELAATRDDELGQLAHAFRLMTDEVHRREDALRQANEGLEHRVEERTRELKEVHQQLVGAARQAGMAEIATNVLHTVGNVLNSVYTSATLARERLTVLPLENVSKVGTLLAQHQGDLAAFLVQNERGRIVVPFLGQLGSHLEKERREILSLLQDLGRYTEHIGTIVKVQQDYASFPKLHEPVRLEELAEDALRINAASFDQPDVKVERHFAPLPPVVTDKHKVLMILVNLLSNARNALEGVTLGERRVTLKLAPSVEGRVRIEIRDTGVGITPELLTRIFEHGFTTRQEGHGFGLHASALAAQELGGSLNAHSEGPGRGATFTLELPASP